MWLTEEDLMEVVNLDEESTEGMSYGAKFDQYGAASDLTQPKLFASKSSKGMDRGCYTITH